MRRIFFVNRYFPPDHSATSQLTGDLAAYLVSCGYSVTAVTSQQLYDQPHALLPSRDILNGIEIHRVPTTKFGRSNLLGRAFDYFSFYASARRYLLAEAQRGDIIIAMTDPPLISVVAMQVAHRRNAHLVNWLQDVYPEIAVELGVPFLNGPLVALISSLRDRSLKAAAANVVVGEQMAGKVSARGVSAIGIRVIANWVEDEQLRPLASNENPLRREWDLENKFVVGYSGNLGRTHEYHTVLGAAERLRDNRHVVFVCIGSGHSMARLSEQVKERGLSNFRFFGYQPRAILRQSLSLPDLHWISLNPRLEGFIVPSKFYGIAAVGRPVIAICAKDGEISRLVQHYQCGIVIEPGEGDQLADAIMRLSSDAELRDLMGRRGRAMLDTNFSRRQSLASWQNVLASIDNAIAST
jgi:colanic acid biosynthesis glycosyl transferase WcaI